MMKEKEEPWNVPLILGAIKKYSPFGLCGGDLIKKNGDPKKTIACTTGCMLIEALDKSRSVRYAFWKSDLAFLEDGKRDLHNAVRIVGEQGIGSPDEEGIGTEVARALNDFYSIPTDAVARMVSFNDTCLEDIVIEEEDLCVKGCRCEDCTYIRKSAREARERMEKLFKGKDPVQGLPPRLAETIFRLRLKYERRTTRKPR